MLLLCLGKGLNKFFFFSCTVKFNGSVWDIYSVMICCIHRVHYALDNCEDVRRVSPQKILLVLHKECVLRG